MQPARPTAHSALPAPPLQAGRTPDAFELGPVRRHRRLPCMVEQNPARIVQPVEVREQTHKIADRDIRPRRVALEVAYTKLTARSLSPTTTMSLSHASAPSADPPRVWMTYNRSRPAALGGPRPCTGRGPGVQGQPPSRRRP